MMAEIKAAVDPDSGFVERHILLGINRPLARRRHGADGWCRVTHIEVDSQFSLIISSECAGTWRSLGSTAVILLLLEYES
jgi:hypothetical protein